MAAVGKKAIADAWALGRGQRLRFAKMLSTDTSGQDLWQAGTMPAAGAWPSVGVANGAVATKATTGAIPFVNPPGGMNLYLAYALLDPAFPGLSTRSGYSGYLLDRIAHVRVACTISGATNTVTGMDATSRLVSGDGARIMPIWLGASNPATKPIWVIDYVNQDGASKSTPACTFAGAGTNFNAIQGLNASSGSGAPYIPLAQGDWGVRSISNINVSTQGSAGSDIGLALVKPITFLPVASEAEPSGPTAVAIPSGPVYGIDLSRVPRIPNDACLQFYTWILSKMSGELGVVAI